MDGAVSEPDAVDWNTGHADPAPDEDDFSARLVLPEGLWEERGGDGAARPRPQTAPPAPAPDASGWDWVVVWGREQR